MEPKILINGKEIKGLEDLPENVKNLLSDDNNNGIPDIAENPLAMFGKLGDLKYLMRNAGTISKNLKGLQVGGVNKNPELREDFTVNGKHYNSWAEVPENDKMEIKAKVQHFTNLGSSTSVGSAGQTGYGGKTGGGSAQSGSVLANQLKSAPSQPPKARLTTFSTQDKMRIAFIIIAGIFILYFFFGNNF
ncbi:hypothetical protein KJ951_04945 [Patescibacteria group bacterium]|nr:hypothetical protein [Patescibacteria group bacterium]MBU1703724.1 hypothetical protein [Patescibacteria group bacterium]MBU1953623.1 hypothetical protein [Patescibacteria group bacterium]